MEVPNYISNTPIYGPVTNGTEILGTSAVTLTNVPSTSYSSFSETIVQGISSGSVTGASIFAEDIHKVLEDQRMEIRYLLDENHALKTKMELLEIQLKFALNRLTEIEKFLENRNSN